MRTGEGDWESEEDKPLNTLEICMLNAHDPSFRKQRLRVVVDELPIDKDIDAMCGDRGDLGLHLVLTEGKRTKGEGVIENGGNRLGEVRE
jgi:hypothetical protein